MAPTGEKNPSAPLEKYAQNISTETVEYNQKERIKAIKKTWECTDNDGNWKVYDNVTIPDEKRPPTGSPAARAGGPATWRPPQPPARPRSRIKVVVKRPEGREADPSHAGHGHGALRSPAPPMDEDRTLNEVLEGHFEDEAEKRFKKLIKGMTE